MDSKIVEAAELIVGLGIGTVLSGAGISVDSGIPHFRGPSGLWEKYDPNEYLTINAFNRNPEKVWNLLAELAKLIINAEPNPAHRGVAELEEMGFLAGVITQNVDGLHQRAGSKNVVEYHGSGDRLICLNCNCHYPAENKRLKQVPPRCDKCSAVLKPDIVFFGEMIPRAALLASQELIEKSGFILVVGTSAVVHPSSMIPHAIKSRGGKIIEINTELTALSEFADISIFASASKAAPELVKAIRRLQN